MWKPMLITFLFAAAFIVAGSQRTAVAEWDGSVMAVQMVMAALFLALPCCILMKGWSRRLELWLMVTLFGVLGADLHAALNESAVRHQHGENPASAVVEKRWFPFAKDTIRYEPAMRKWMGDD